jgi:hypothetical protein
MYNNFNCIIVVKLIFESYNYLLWKLYILLGRKIKRDNLLNRIETLKSQYLCDEETRTVLNYIINE